MYVHAYLKIGLHCFMYAMRLASVLGAITALDQGQVLSSLDDHEKDVITQIKTGTVRYPALTQQQMLQTDDDGATQRSKIAAIFLRIVGRVHAFRFAVL